MGVTGSTLPMVRQIDLKDPNLIALNSLLQHNIWQQIVALSGGSGNINLASPVIAPDFQNPSQLQVPSNPQSLLTLNAALQLFSPANIRQALTSGVFSTSSTSAVSVQPLPSGGTGSTPTPPTPGMYQQPTNIICLGDSLTVGYPGEPPNSYPGQMAERLATPVTNLGQDGAQSSNVIATQLPQAISLYDPLRLNIALLLIGRNDLAGGVSVATLETNVTSIVTSLHATGTSVQNPFVVIVCTIVPSGLAGQPPSFQANRVTYNNWVLAGSSGADQACNGGNDPLYADLTVSPYSTFSSVYFDPSDHVHLTKAGYAVLAINMAACALNFMGPPAPLPIDPFGAVLTGSFARDISYFPYINVYDFGVLSTASAAINSQGIIAACATAQKLGLPVVFPENSYNITKINLLAYNGYQQYPLTLMSLANDKNSNGHGTRLICDSTGTSWLRAAINVVAPNSGNTAPDWSQQLHGLRLQGIYLDQVSGISGGSLSGIWLGHVWDFTVQDCGAITPPASGYWNCGIETWSCTASVINRFRALNCASGIALNGGVGATGLPTVSSSIMVVQPDCENCTSAGITTQFSQDCKIIGGYLINNAVGFYGNGPRCSLDKVYFGSNTADVNMLSATAPYGGTVNPDAQTFTDCYFSANVNVNHSAGTSFVVCKWGGGSSLTIASTASATNLLQQNSFPSSFTDAGVATYIASALIGTVNPNSGGGTPGITGQFIYDATHSVLYMCTTSGVAGTAVWTAMPGAGGSGITSLNTLTGPALNITNGGGLGISAGGTSIQLTVTGPVASTTYSPTWADLASAATITPGTVNAAYSVFGKWCYIRIDAASVAVSVTNCNVITITLPVTAKNSGGAILHGGGYGLQSVATGFALAGFMIFNGGGTQIQIAGPAAFASGSSYGVFIEMVYETT